MTETPKFFQIFGNVLDLKDSLKLSTKGIAKNPAKILRILTKSRMLAFLAVFFMICLRSQCFVRIFGLKPLPVGLKSPATVTVVSEFSMVRMS